jgi:magnesium-transporting ATPase (P-type)
MWKNAITSFMPFFFNLHNGFSAGSPYDDTFYSLYEVTCTAFAIMLYLIFEQQVDMKHSNNESGIGFKLSHYYKHCRDNILEKTGRHYLCWMLMSFISSIALFYVPFYAYASTTSVDSSGKTDGLYASSFTSVTIMVVVHHGFMWIGTRGKSWWLIMWYVISFLLFFPVTTFLNNVIVSSGIFLSTFNYIMQSATYWLSLVLTSSTMILIYCGVHAVWDLNLYPEFLPKQE